MCSVKSKPANASLRIPRILGRPQEERHEQLDFLYLYIKEVELAIVPSPPLFPS